MDASSAPGINTKLGSSRLLLVRVVSGYDLLAASLACIATFPGARRWATLRTSAWIS
jgi:hypothetical protein